MDKKEYKNLDKAYKKSIARLANNVVEDSALLPDCFVMQLKHVRDVSLLKGLNKTNIQGITLLSTAIEEYYSYKDCFNKYFTLTEYGPQRKNTDKTTAETITDYSKEKKLHWDTFWELVRLNLESWVNDPMVMG